MLLIACSAVLTGGRSFAAIGQWARSAPQAAAPQAAELIDSIAAEENMGKDGEASRVLAWSRPGVTTRGVTVAVPSCATPSGEAALRFGEMPRLPSPAPSIMYPGHVCSLNLGVSGGPDKGAMPGRPWMQRYSASCWGTGAAPTRMQGRTSRYR
ncbi:hypothetical protein AB0D04_26340 [Streptomyces sp. NPDC048483]|uniref:hypothetical protein n=1 Tax=Streptomyces sp. NPDC048483 TaxID=3154927 RepID=UPI003441F50C